MELSIEKIENTQDFRNLKNIWNELLSNKTNYRPFLDHDWFELWLSHFKNGHRLFIVVVKDNISVKAIFPLLIKKEKFKGIPTTKVELIGNVYSPVRNFILSKLSNSEKEMVLLKLFEYLKTLKNWGLIDLNALPEEDFDLMDLKKVLNKVSLKNKEYFCFGNWYLNEINFTGNQYLQSRNTNIRENSKRYRRKLEKMGKLELKIVNSGSDSELNLMMDSYYKVYETSWKSPELDPTFHRDLAKLASDKGWLRLGFLFLDNKAIACQFWLVCEDTAYILKLAYDEEYRKVIPGVILSSEMMKYVIDIDHVKEIDYLIGDEPYKKDWTPQRRERRGILVFNNNIHGLILAFLVLNVNPIITKNKYLGILKKLIPLKTRYSTT